MVVAGGGHFVAAVAGEHVHQMVDAETLAGAEYAAERLLRRFGGVEGLRRVQTGVAVAARLLQVFAEVVQQRLTAAVGDFAEPQHRFQALVFVAFELLVAFRLRQHLLVADGVFQAVGHPGGGGLAVTAGAHFAERRPDVYFVLLNTPRLDSKTRANVVHLPAIFDEAKKAAFIRSCDAMLHARAEGETFGMAVAEFSVHNKPVLTYARAPAAARHHLDTLGDRALLYHNEAQLVKMLGDFNRTDAAARDWNAYRPYAVGEVMKTFAKAFGLAELPAECRGAPS